MPVVADVELKLEVAAFLEAQGEAMRHPRAQELSAWAVEEARGLVAPGLVYEWVPAEVVGEREVRLGGVLMRVGRHAELMLPAQEAFVAVATIGAALEERAREVEFTMPGRYEVGPMLRGTLSTLPGVLEVVDL